ncbi:beta-lactamase/transpeptidase-like protein [Xylaria bambusicola]|uniref:beta-lactamase/transpeptidase-like protein n=1 Tax=Xylaria bambusicola TaxID=326684 RepID=UPI0020088523|nr:beta-lactamase/transpeptidase-like protein [Xylaria bambusicola]KAI0505879.1 beta-lactamase/transpeptidase-like protein [Xylaria bambusicola]
MIFQSHRTPSTLGAFLLLANGALAARDGLCPPLGPVMPVPINPSGHDLVQDAIRLVTDKFQNLTADFNTTGISIAVKSIYEENPMIELHHTPPVLDNTSTTAVDSETIYRIGSLSKLFAVLSILTQGQMKLEDPITKYVPELLQLRKEAVPVANDITAVHWDQVTVGSLTSHMSGIGTDLVNDLASFPADFAQVGLPQLTNSSKTGCAGLFGLPVCTRAEFFRDFGKRHPVYAPWTNPVYSNVASSILGFAVESATNMSYDAYVQQAIFGPLGMTNTTIFEAPKERSWGFIPKGDIWFGSSLGYEDIAGGLYSNTKDILALGTGILQNRLLDPVATRQWMKPITSTSSPGFMLGGPWEILRSDTVTKDQRLIEYYTKSGNLGSYNNIICLIPDYGLVITILSGGGESSADTVDFTLTDVITALLPAIEDASKTQAESHFGGTYADAATNSSITLSVDDGPGFAVTNWTVRGVDIVENYSAFGALSSSPTNLPVRVRLYPTNLSSGCEIAWRAYFNVGTPEQLAEGDAKRFWPKGTCHTWASMDRLVYGFKSIDEFIFTTSKGQAKSLSLPAFDVRLKREA